MDLRFTLLAAGVAFMAACGSKQASTTAQDGTAEADSLTNYLLVYHQDATHGLHMAVSRDGYTFATLNGGEPVFRGDTIAVQKGIRDPHIYRGPDGCFYLAMTDLHIYAQRDGYRDTEWERPGDQYGWGNNRGLVLMKSSDLINWTRTNLMFDSIAPEYAGIGCVWAPETIYDNEAGQLMIYYTSRMGVEPNRLYSVHVSNDYNRLLDMPELLYTYPDSTKNAIDADITYYDGKYHMMYVAHDNGAGIKHAVSDKLTGPWQYIDDWVDQEEHACEAPNVWKRQGTDRYVLMYDIYGIQPHNFGFMETTDFKTFTPLGRFNEGVMKTVGFTSPKHGAVIPLSRAEADRLIARWGIAQAGNSI